MSDATLEAALRDLGRHVAWPETPDVVRGVRAELERDGEVRPLPADRSARPPS